MSEARPQIQVLITGRVQGVWYRGWTVKQATRLGLDGWVRNREDGSVEAVFAGPDDQLGAMIDLCRQGPPAARVDGIEEASFEGVVDPGFRQVT